jgi:tRNA (cmo5U34)-methyltransferase
VTDPELQWTEGDSTLYQKIAPVAVPARAEQLAVILSLLPFETDQPVHVVEIGAGEGILSAALLSSFQQATVTALDGSPEMRRHINQRLTPFQGRGEVISFNLESPDWYQYLVGADAVISSLCIHHLSGAQKKELFAALYRNISSPGALIIADLVEPQKPAPTAMFAATWDYHTHQQSLRINQSPDLFELFQQVEWNLYHYPDPVDKPSPLFQQLQWLDQTGFSGVDCFWMLAGHAIYGGYKGCPEKPGAYCPFETALKNVQAQLGTG